MTVQDLMDFYDCKTQKQLHEKIKVSRVSIWKWKKYGIPFRTQTSFEVLSKGKLKAKTPSGN